MKTKFYQQYDLYFISQCKHLIENAEYEKMLSKTKMRITIFAKPITSQLSIYMVSGVQQTSKNYNNVKV